MVPCHVYLSIGLLECPHNMAAGFPQKAFYDLLSEVTHHHVHKRHWLLRSALFMRKGTTQGHKSLLPGGRNHGVGDNFESALRGGAIV